MSIIPLSKCSRTIKNIVKENGCRHESSTPTMCRPYYFHINTSDSYDETQGQVQRWVTFTYFSRPIANKGTFVITI